MFFFIRRPQQQKVEDEDEEEGEQNYVSKCKVAIFFSNKRYLSKFRIERRANEFIVQIWIINILNIKWFLVFIRVLPLLFFSFIQFHSDFA
jgi:hypothetical protein